MKRIISALLIFVFFINFTNLSFADDVYTLEVLRQMDTIEMEDMNLQKPTDEDLKKLAKYYMDDDVKNYLNSNDTIKNEDEAFEDLKKLNEDDKVSFIIKNKNGSPMGEVSLFHLGRNIFNVSYWIGKPFWGHGYVPRAVNQLIKIISSKVSGITFSFSADENNIKSLKTIEKIEEYMTINKINYEFIKRDSYRIKYKICKSEIDNTKYNFEIYVNGQLCEYSLLTKEQILNITYKRIFDTKEIEFNRFNYMIKLAQ